jgi:hypothetical protein
LCIANVEGVMEICYNRPRKTESSVFGQDTAESIREIITVGITEKKSFFD